MNEKSRIHRINFIEKKAFSLTYRTMAMGAGVLFAICFGLGGLQVVRTTLVTKKTAALTEEVKKLNVDKERYMRAMAASNTSGALSETRTVLLDSFENSVSWAAVLRELSSQMPQSLWLSSLTSNDRATSAVKKGLILNGQAILPVYVAQFVKSLSSSPYFENVTLVSLQQVRSAQGEIYQFVIDLSLSLRKSKGVGA